MLEFIKSNQSFLFHILIWAVLIFGEMIDQEDYSHLMVFAFISLLNIYRTSRKN